MGEMARRFDEGWIEAEKAAEARNPDLMAMGTFNGDYVCGFHDGYAAAAEAAWLRAMDDSEHEGYWGAADEIAEGKHHDS